MSLFLNRTLILGHQLLEALVDQKFVVEICECFTFYERLKTRKLTYASQEVCSALSLHFLCKIVWQTEHRNPYNKIITKKT